MSIGVVIPTFREAENIGALISAVLEELPDARIAVIDDTPDTSTIDAVARLACPNVQAVHRSEKGGRGSAALAGMKMLLASGCETIVEMDADFSHDPHELPMLVDSLQSETAAMVIGSRYLPSSRIVDWPVARRIFSRFANMVARALLGVPINDYTNGYRVYGCNAAHVVSETCGRLGKGFIPLSEIVVNLYYRGHRIAEVPTVFVNRARGESSVTVAEISNAMIGLIRIYGLKRRLSSRKVTA